MKRDVCNIVFGGVGGQGILKASEICALAALYEGHHVRKSEVHGMAQRGGSVESHVRFGSAVYSALVPVGSADFLVCFHAEEHERLKPFLKEGGTDLTACLGPALRAVTRRQHLNTYLVGVLSARLPFEEASWMKALEAVFDARILKENIKVFVAGRSAQYDLE
ncbi:MAG TPA: 2-oxoacid:acceptor oxidoreductase family protein [Anaerohalosphaeraceae bacterium]|jgi:indolepyruvate ferredoxin oxidoreductase beta subunit|nr:2-oxoacid:acceptor oxidoreductase family protein [Anaerohalosphaeraceae bacterium]HRT52188.1 2-oxoacid:acceptor oxidoreductase family protein [Anaerohalosphaeraceae bacterium]HRT87184.1 2-oxoacid:acceptor oxidoreductase family protein [Anaerohalosphaeraceae bacterium]